MRKLKGVITMLHPSYADLMQVLNSDVEPGEQPVVNSRYSVVLVQSKESFITEGQGHLQSFFLSGMEMFWGGELSSHNSSNFTSN